MPLLGQILTAAFIVSLISFMGASLIFNEERVRRFAHFILSFAIGALFGVSFLELIPEAVRNGSIDAAMLFVLLGILLFFILEKLLVWYHCHEGKCPVHIYTYLNLTGDFLHNFIDGVIIAVTFLVDIKLGIATTVAIALHEIPQEIADFGILVQGGLSYRRALFYNFLTGLSALIGAGLAYYFSSFFTPYLSIALALIAGNFIYIAAIDLMPELHELTTFSHSLIQLILIILGALLVIAPGFILGA